MDPFWILTLVAAGLLLGAGAAGNRRDAKAASRRPVKGAAKRGAAGGGSGASRRSGGASKAGRRGGNHVRSWAAGKAAALWEKRRGYWKFGPGHPETKTGDRAHCAYCMRRFADSDRVRAHIKAKHPGARTGLAPPPDPQPSGSRNGAGPASQRSPKTTPAASGGKPDGTKGGTWMDKVEGAAEKVRAVSDEPISNIVEFDERITLLRRFGHMYADLIEQTHNDARRMGIAPAVLAPIVEAFEAAGTEVPESLLQAGRAVRSKYAAAIDHAEAGVDLNFFNVKTAG